MLLAGPVFCIQQHRAVAVSMVAWTYQQELGYLLYPAIHRLYALADWLLLASSAQILHFGKMAVFWTDEDSSRSMTTAALLTYN